MLTPEATHLIIKHFDAIDEAVSKKLIRKRPWSEPALSSFLCDLLDYQTQEEEKLTYSIKELNKELSEFSDLLEISLNIETHEYDNQTERYVTQADIGLVIKYDDYLLPENSFTRPWLLQAKRLYPANHNPIQYTELSKFKAVNNDQKERMKKLEEIIGYDFIRYLLFCPRPNAVDNLLNSKITHLRTNNLSRNIFDYTLGLELHKEISKKESTLAAGMFICDMHSFPNNFIDVHRNILGSTIPFSWFIVSHFNYDGPINAMHHLSHRNPKGLDKDDNCDSKDWAIGITKGDKTAVKRFISTIKENEIDAAELKIFPPHTITINISIGKNLNSDFKRIRQ